jgi:fibronectin-binding autotransporter adhesin
MRFTNDFISRSATLLVAACVINVFTFGTTARAQFVWTGGGGVGDGLWNKNVNWSGSAPAANTTNAYVFGGNLTRVELAPNNNLAGMGATSILFATNATNSFNLTGNSINMVGGMTNLSTLTQTNSMALVLATNQVQFDTASNNITLAGVISGTGQLVKLGASTLILTAANTYTNATVISNGTLQVGNGGTTGSIVGVITNNASLVYNRSDTITQTNVISGTGSVTKNGSGTLVLATNNTFAGGFTLNTGAVRAQKGGSFGSGFVTQASGSSTVEIDTTETVTNAMSLFNIATLQTVTLSGAKTLNGTTYNVASGTTTTESGLLSGAGGLTKTGTGTLSFTASNSFSGATAVNAGVLNLNSTTGSALGSTTGLSVASGATLLLSQSGQVNDSAAVTLSGGTIRRGGTVNEVFGNLTVTTGSFLDYGAANGLGTVRFGTYTPSSLLTVQNFLPGNKLQFGNTLTEAQLNNTSLFSFSSPWTTSIEDGFFTITAIPEPSTYAAAAGLLGLMLWPSRRRIIRDAKKILGLRAPMRDRLAARRAS